MQQNRKKTFLVIGKMGHGKSSFTKMLVEKQQKQFIICSNEMTSVTQNCKLYKVDPQIQVIIGFKSQEKLFVLDTPGIQSYTKNHIVREMIIESLMKQQIEVIGIAYILNYDAGRQFDNEERSAYAQFHKLFPIQKERKNKLSFFVITGYDRHYNQPETSKQKQQSLQDLFIRNGITIFEKRMNWMSQPSKDITSFLGKIEKSKMLQEKNNLTSNQKHSYQNEPSLYNSYIQQFSQLGKFLNESMVYSIQYTQIQDGLKKLSRRILNRSFEYQQKSKKNLEVVQQKFQISFKTKNFQTEFGFWQSLSNLFKSSHLQKKEFISSCNLKLNDKKISKSFHQNVLRQIKSKHLEQLYQSFELQRTTNELRFNNKSWILNPSIYKCKDTRSVEYVKKSANKNQTHYFTRINPNSSYQLQFQLQTPTEDTILRLSNKLSEQVFYAKNQNMQFQCFIHGSNCPNRYASKRERNNYIFREPFHQNKK